MIIKMGVLENSAEALARRNCASILLHRQAAQSSAADRADSGPGVRNFKCKSCDRAFETFQALGGHRASHNKLGLTDANNNNGTTTQDGRGLVVHQCRECRIGFPTGQALGGHMRKHVDLNAKRKRVEEDDDNESVQAGERKRVVLHLDLNFPPPMEDYSLFCS